MVSIIIPCWNKGRWLNAAVRSALDQTHRNIQVTVIDDGSTDNSRAVAQAFGGRVSYYYQPNAGLPAARNLGISKMAGDYAVFLDADDTLEPDFVTSCLQVLDTHPEAAYVYTQLRLVGSQSGVTHYPQFARRRLVYGNFISACIMIRAELIKQFKYDPALRQGWEDYDLYLTLAEHGYNGILLNRPLLNYRKHGGTDESLADKIDLAQEKANLLNMHRRHQSLTKPWSRLVVECLYFVKSRPILMNSARTLVRLGRAGS